MLAGGNQQPWFDLLGVALELEFSMAVERVEGRDPGLEQGEEDNVKLRDVGQLHQSGVAFAKPAGRQPRGQVGGQLVQLGIAEATFTANNRWRVGL